MVRLPDRRAEAFGPPRAKQEVGDNNGGAERAAARIHSDGAGRPAGVIRWG
jgi:hypothetical protein